MDFKNVSPWEIVAWLIIVGIIYEFVKMLPAAVKKWVLKVDRVASNTEAQQRHLENIINESFTLILSAVEDTKKDVKDDVKTVRQELNTVRQELNDGLVRVHQRIDEYMDNKSKVKR